MRLYRVVRKDEFRDRITLDGQGRLVEDSGTYDEDRFGAIDGRALKACDHLAAFTEAALSIAHGVQSAELKRGAAKLKTLYRTRSFPGIDFVRVMEETERYFQQDLTE